MPVGVLEAVDPLVEGGHTAGEALAVIVPVDGNGTASFSAGSVDLGDSGSHFSVSEGQVSVGTHAHGITAAPFSRRYAHAGDTARAGQPEHQPVVELPTRWRTARTERAREAGA